MTIQEDYATTVTEGGFNAEAKEAGLGRIRKEVQLKLSESGRVSRDFQGRM